jgi:hypothetical protein
VIDPSVASPATVHVYANGRIAGGTLAKADRTDVAKAYPGFGPGHGFDTVVPTSAAGRNRICTYGIDVGPGSNSLLGCRDLTVSYDPFGSADSVRRTSPTTVEVAGWVIDPDVGSPTEAHVYVDGVLRAELPAERVRGDIARRYPDYGGRHGFLQSVDVEPGAHRICVYAGNVERGRSQPMRCTTV